MRRIINFVKSLINRNMEKLKEKRGYEYFLVGAFFASLFIIFPKVILIKDPYVNVILSFGAIFLQMSTLLAVLSLVILFLLRALYYDEEFYKQLSKGISAGAGIALGTFLALFSIEFIKLTLGNSNKNTYYDNEEVLTLSQLFVLLVSMGLILLYIPAAICFWISDSRNKPSFRLVVSLALIFILVNIAVYVITSILSQHRNHISHGLP